MKIKLTNNAITGGLSLSRGQVLGTPRYSEAFLNHLVEADVAERLDYETKVEPVDEVKAEPVPEKKKRSLKKKRGLSSRRDRALQSKTSPLVKAERTSSS